MGEAVLAIGGESVAYADVGARIFAMNFGLITD
jgi:hypothetical protein